MTLVSGEMYPLNFAVERLHQILLETRRTDQQLGFDYLTSNGSWPFLGCLFDFLRRPCLP